MQPVQELGTLDLRLKEHRLLQKCVKEIVLREVAETAGMDSSDSGVRAQLIRRNPVLSLGL